MSSSVSGRGRGKGKTRGTASTGLLLSGAAVVCTGEARILRSTTVALKPKAVASAAAPTFSTSTSGNITTPGATCTSSSLLTGSTSNTSQLEDDKSGSSRKKMGVASTPPIAICSVVQQDTTSVVSKADISLAKGDSLPHSGLASTRHDLDEESYSQSLPLRTMSQLLSLVHCGEDDDGGTVPAPKIGAGKEEKVTRLAQSQSCLPSARPAHSVAHRCPADADITSEDDGVFDDVTYKAASIISDSASSVHDADDGLVQEEAQDVCKSTPQRGKEYFAIFNRQSWHTAAPGAAKQRSTTSTVAEQSRQRPQPAPASREPAHTSSRPVHSATGPSARRTAGVWSFFALERGQEHVVKCCLCKKLVRRGKPDATNLGTSSMRAHMKCAHFQEWSAHLKDEGRPTVHSIAEQHKDCFSSMQTPGPFAVQGREGVKEADQSLALTHTTAVVPEGIALKRKLAVMPQPNLFLTLGKTKPYDKRHPRVHLLNCKLAEMLVVDMLPFSFVERKGFRELMHAVDPRWVIPSRNYFIREAVPNLYREVVACVGKALARSEGRKVHITTVMRMSAQSVDYMAVTAHWVIFPAQVHTSQELNFHSQNYTYRQVATLCMDNFLDLEDEAPNVFAKLQSVIAEWLSIRNLGLGFVTSDNSSNIAAALKQGHFVQIPCFVHVLHLVVTQFLNASEQVSAMLGRARKICAHFCHSTRARNSLRHLQKTYNLPLHQLKLDVRTRWNSTLYMLERLHEQSKAVNDYCVNNVKLLQGAYLETCDWRTMSNVCNILHPFEEATLMVSRGDVGLSEILPLIFILEVRLGDMKAESKDSDETEFLERVLDIFQADPCIAMMKQSKEYMLATFLDPRFKTRVADMVSGQKTQESTLECCKRILVDKLAEGLKQDELEKESRNLTVPLASPSASHSETSSDSQMTPVSTVPLACPVAKKSREAAAGTHSLWGLCREYGLCKPTAAQSKVSEPTPLDMVTAYLNDTSCQLGPKDEPLHYWEGKRGMWPTVLVRLAVEYLSCPASSVMSARVFSAAGAAILERYTSLTSSNVEKLQFIKMNEHHIPPDYGSRPLQVTHMRSNRGSNKSDEYLLGNVNVIPSPSVSSTGPLESLDSEWESESISDE